MHQITRRSFLATAAGAALAASIGSAATVQAGNTNARNLAWVWRFDRDGLPDDVASELAAHGLGITLKTHDGVDWAGNWDRSGHGVNGPVHVHRLSQFFETRGIPFHAWCVVQGTDPQREAQMASQVLNAGARSITFDLEPPEGRNYWLGASEDARVFGEVVRGLQPHATLMVAPDARPWQLAKVPMAEFAAFTDRILPQTYWRTFDSPTNLRLMRERGFDVSDGMTPELILEAASAWLGPYGKPIEPIGQADAAPAEWGRFLTHATRLGMQAASAWRYGTAQHGVFSTLGGFANPEATRPASTASPPATPLRDALPDPAQRGLERLGFRRWWGLR